MATCQRCNEFSFGEGNHRCPPEWIAWNRDCHGDDPAEGDRVFAHDAEAAAEKWAEIYDQDDYPLMSGGDAEVVITPANGEGEPKRFTVYGESSPTYYAREITDEAASA
jgi:hypothetical protein